MKAVELNCTFDECTQEWLVWFPHPLGGISVLESFADETQARAFHQEQIASAELSGCDGCNECASELRYNEQYDAYYCTRCDTWLEDQCEDSECNFCPSRPLLPSQVNN